MKKEIVYGSLFSGIGGFDLGFDQASMRCAWQVEKDAMAQGVLANHWPDIKKYKEVQDVGKRNLSPVDLICGGFPCQDVSLAGRRKGLAGERSGLWFEFIRIVNELKPEWVVVENVPGLLSSNRGRDMGTIVGGLAKCGYWWAYRIIDAQYHGIPQRRRRVFIVASLTKGRPQQVLFERDSSPWDTPPRREARPSIARGIERGPSNVRQSGEAGEGQPRAGQGGHNAERVGKGDIAIPAIAQSNRGVPTGNLSETLRAESHGSLPMVAFTQNSRNEVRLINGDGQIAGAIAAQPGMKQQDYLAFGGNNTKGEIEVATACDAHGSGGYDFESETFICGALPAHSKRHGHAMGTQQAAESGHLIAATLNSGGNDGGFRTELGEHLVVTPTLTGKIADGNRKGWAPVNEADALVVWDNGQGDPNAEESDVSYCLNGQVNQSVGVRRLTPLECERLQGFPDCWTKHGIKAGKIIEQSDSARYRQLGNAVAVPVAKWIGQRIIRSLLSPVRRIIAAGDGDTLDAALDAAVAQLRRSIAAIMTDEPGCVASIRLEAQVRLVKVDSE